MASSTSGTSSGISYAELCAQSSYSFLRAASQPQELVERAAQLGLSAIALTDRGGVYGLPKAYYAFQNLAPNSSSLKLISGAELPIKDHPSLNLLALNREGYALLCRMLTKAHEDRPKGESWLTMGEFCEFMETYRTPRPELQGQLACAQGLLVIPEIPLHEWERNLEFYGVLSELFQDRMKLPISRFLDGWDAKRFLAAQALLKHTGAPLVATNRVCYASPERRQLADVLSCIREGVPLKDAGFRLSSNGERYLKSPAQMQALFSGHPEYLYQTLEVAERCTFSVKELRYRYPSEWIPKGETAQAYLTRLTWEGARRRYPPERYPRGIPTAVEKQLKHELSLIEQLTFADYFLTIWEIVEFARGRGILCQGRGSAANSAVCFCLEITAIDPVRMNLLFERFISAERGEPPDIDVDFEHERREEVIQHIYEKYGRDRAGMVSAVITYRSRSARRDLEKLGLGAPETPEALDPLDPWIEQIRGLPRHLSIHSGGFTLSADPLIETVPIEPARMEGRTIVQWDKEDLAIAGLLKVDILALGMLSALRKTFDLVRVREELTIATIPPDDPKTYAMIQKADTIGVFQIESRAQMSMLGRLLPRNFYDLVIEVAIVRPGPIVGKMVHPFLKRRWGMEPVTWPHPKLKEILGRTIGVPLFQEQVMKIAIALGGFTAGEADELRRALRGGRSSGSPQALAEKMARKLVAGLLKEGLPQEFVDRIFLQIQGFAEYGFPESHAASFALIAYASSYLKCHYPAEFTCSLLNSQPMGFYSNHTLIEDAKRHGVRVLPVDPQHSGWDCTLEGGALRLGLKVVHGLGKAAAEQWLQARVERPFKGLIDFLSRTHLSPSVLFSLAMGDVFSSFKLSQRDALWEVLAHRLLVREGEGGQASLFQFFGQPSNGGPVFSELGRAQSIQQEFRSFGLSLKGHPLQIVREIAVGRLPLQKSASLKERRHGDPIQVAGMVIVRQRPPTAGGCVFATLEDEEGFVDLILKPEVFERFGEVFLNSPFIVVAGKVQRDRNTIGVLVNSLRTIEFGGEQEPELPRGRWFH
ncbi:PHP domain-containing protein [Bdellovibrionota bacterium FG-2]